MALKLITETTFSDLILEKSDSGDLFIEGIFMQAERKNHNGRIYPVRILENEVRRFDNEYIKTHRAMGELNHPTSPQVNPERASHLITSIRQNGNDFTGKAKILTTPQGNIVRSLLDGGVKLGVSSRGLGSLKEGEGHYTGSKVVQNDYKMVTVDIVSNPSAPEAFVNGIYESVSYMINDGIISECLPNSNIKITRLLKESRKRRYSIEEQTEQLYKLINML